MNREKAWEDFTALPLEAQQLAADFIAFLAPATGNLRLTRRLTCGDCPLQHDGRS